MIFTQCLITDCFAMVCHRVCVDPFSVSQLLARRFVLHFDCFTSELCVDRQVLLRFFPVLVLTARPATTGSLVCNLMPYVWENHDTSKEDVQFHECLDSGFINLLVNVHVPSKIFGSTVYSSRTLNCSWMRVVKSSVTHRLNGRFTRSSTLRHSDEDSSFSVKIERISFWSVALNFAARRKIYLIWIWLLVSLSNSRRWKTVFNKGKKHKGNSYFVRKKGRWIWISQWNRSRKNRRSST